MDQHPLFQKLLWYLGTGIGLGVLVQGGIPIPGIPPIGAPGFWLNVGLWPAELLAGLLGQPIYLQPAVQTPGVAVSPRPGVVVQTPSFTFTSNQPTATPWGY